VNKKEPLEKGVQAEEKKTFDYNLLTPYQTYELLT
jgi:hypothetical protein